MVFRKNVLKIQCFFPQNKGFTLFFCPNLFRTLKEKHPSGISSRLSDREVILVIRKVKEGYRVVSESGRNMGTYATKEEAEKRLKQIEYFKHKRKGRNS